MELITNRMSSMHRLMVLLVAEASFIANNLTAFLIDEILIEGYMLIASTDDIVTLSLFTYSSSSLYFSSYA